MRPGPVSGRSVSQGDHLDVEVGVGGPESLHAQLVVLTVATGLRPLIPEGRCHVPGLPRQRGPVLDEGPDHGRGPLGAESQGAAAPVLELVHLLAHHVAALADAAAEDPDVLEDRGVGQAVAGRLHLGREGSHQRLPAGRLRPQDVVGATRGARRPGLVRHRGSVLLSGEDPVDVVDGVEMPDQVEDRLEMSRGRPAPRRTACG